MNKVSSSLISRETLLAETRLLLQKPNFSREDSARCAGLMDLADRLRSNGAGNGDADREMRAFESALRSLAPGQKHIPWQSREARDMGVSTGAGGGDFVPASFRQELGVAMKAYDALFDSEVCMYFETARGSPCGLPYIDDTASAAAIVGEGSVSSEVDPTPAGVVLPAAPTWRSGLVKVSTELLADTAFPVSSFLASAFGIRFARGIGASLVTTLLSAAKLGATATGDANKTGANASNSIGYGDLLGLRTSVNPAYRATPKTCWVMNDNTLSALDGLCDKQGHPIIDADDRDANGRRLLLGWPVAVSPSMPDIGAGATPIAFGALAYFILRTVPQVTTIQVFTERFAEYGQVAFESRFRCNAGLLAAGGSDAPVKYLANGS